MRPLVLLTLLVLSTAAAFAQDPARPPADGSGALSVGTKDAPPFVMRGADGRWTGITIDLLDAAAREMGRDYTLRELSLAALLDSVAVGALDAGAAALTVTAAREARLDFTQPYYVSGLGIATRQGSRWWSAVRSLLSPALLKVVLALLLLLLIVGAVVWAVERKANEDHFGGSIGEGIGSGLWWSAVTMTTVGYGDKAPRTIPGRVIGLLWMFVALIITSSFTAAITSAVTVSHLASQVQSASDLPGVRVGAVSGATGAEYLDAQGIDFVAYPTVEDALRALNDEEVEAVVHDKPILSYLAEQRFPRATVLGETVEPQYYAIAVPQGSPLREPLSRAILSIIERESWKRMVATYLGD